MVNAQTTADHISHQLYVQSKRLKYYPKLSESLETTTTLY